MSKWSLFSTVAKKGAPTPDHPNLGMNVENLLHSEEGLTKEGI